MSKKWVYTFGDGKAEGNSTMKNLLGGKGSNLAEMCNIGLPIPAGFTITTEVCTQYYKNSRNLPDELKSQVISAIRHTEQIMKAEFGDPANPLLLSVRSGARASMPGMMDTILNLGLNDEIVKGFIKKTDNPRAGWDSYRRFIQMYSDVVLGVEHSSFEHLLDDIKKSRGVKIDTELEVEDLINLVDNYKKIVIKETGQEFPSDPDTQLWGAIKAVFDSWNTKRAIKYRTINHIPDEWGTAVNVMAMVFGNMGWNSGTGVAFTRNPATGENKFYGEYLRNAQGEDVVAGIRTPQPVNESDKTSKEQESLEKALPGSYKQLMEIRDKLEKHYREMQDIEFTVQEGKLWMLQTRNGKRTGFAAVRIAVEMAEEGLISIEDAVLRVEPEGIIQLLAPVFDDTKKAKMLDDHKLLAKGLNAGPGAAAGRVVFTARDAEVTYQKYRGDSDKSMLILVRHETSPEDIGGMVISQGILTAKGGMTSHAAVVARGMGIPCVAGCEALQIDYRKKEINIQGKIIKEGDWISIDGFTGEVILGKIPAKQSEIIQVLVDKTKKPEESYIYQLYYKFMGWAEKYRDMGVRTNADTPRDSAVARAFGAEGIGLCRTEHMFFEEERINSMREMILSDSTENREKALAKILPYQKQDFYGILKAMEGLPVTIRTLDPPLHEFLPQDAESIRKVASIMNVSPEKITAKVKSLHEINPMLGHRGCRLGIAYPEITAMQARAIFEAACELTKEGYKVYPEVMIPLISTLNELRLQKSIVIDEAIKAMSKYGVEIEYLVGTMIEIPRACLTADEIAGEAQFFSFGTNDLTQMTFGFSRDDIGSFLPQYLEQKILPCDPFARIDETGVGKLVQMGVEKGRMINEKLKIGVCGEHGGEPNSVRFFYRTGLNYVSCSPRRVPVAILTAAQEGLKRKLGK